MRVSVRTIQEALATAQSLGLPRLDAQLLLLLSLGKPDSDRAWLLAHDTDVLLADTVQTFRGLAHRRAAGEPLAYLVGYKEFFGLRFKVDNSVLIPRPDTETLVQWALDTVAGLDGNGTPQVLDLGTGSGAVAICLAHHLKVSVTATDVSEQALCIARQNAQGLGVDVQFLQSNWLGSVKGRFHLMVSNPPYIAVDDPHLAALIHEPLTALTAGANGLSDLQQIIQQAPGHLLPGGWLLLEHGYDQATAVCQHLRQRGFAHVQSRMDLAGIARCSGGQWQQPNSGIIQDC